MEDKSLIPTSLYKYKSFNSNGHYKDLLEKNILFFSSPKWFNDPFDCRVYPQYESGTDKEIFKKIKELILEEHPTWPKWKINSETKIIFDKNINEIKDPKEMLKRVNEHINSYYGIVSFSEINNNILMWSHYSDSHKGFYIEFDAHKIFDISANYLIKRDQYMRFHKVEYSKEYPEINPFATDFDNSQYMRMITTKSIEWIYEREWRLVYFNFPDKVVAFPEEVITAIYFGVNCSEESITECKNLLSTRKIIPSLYKAELQSRSYGLSFKKVSF